MDGLLLAACSATWNTEAVETLAEATDEVSVAHGHEATAALKALSVQPGLGDKCRDLLIALSDDPGSIGARVLADDALKHCDASCAPALDRDDPVEASLETCPGSGFDPLVEAGWTPHNPRAYLLLRSLLARMHEGLAEVDAVAAVALSERWKTLVPRLAGSSVELDMPERMTGMSLERRMTPDAFLALANDWPHPDLAPALDPKCDNRRCVSRWGGDDKADSVEVQLMPRSRKPWRFDLTDEVPEAVASQAIDRTTKALGPPVLTASGADDDWAEHLERLVGNPRKAGMRVGASGSEWTCAWWTNPMEGLEICHLDWGHKHEILTSYVDRGVMGMPNETPYFLPSN